MRCLTHGKLLYCFMPRWPARETIDRFMSHVEKTETCWTWTGSRRRDGYGQFVLGRRPDGRVHSVPAHRWLYVYCNGPVPHGLEIDHLCRNRSCVSPEHLEAVTARENVRRGQSPAADNARRTHCVRGHEFTPDNTLRRTTGGRTCRTCNRERCKSFYYGRRAG